MVLYFFIAIRTAINRDFWGQRSIIQGFIISMSPDHFILFQKVTNSPNERKKTKLLRKKFQFNFMKNHKFSQKFSNINQSFKTLRAILAKINFLKIFSYKNFMKNNSDYFIRFLRKFWKKNILQFIIKILHYFHIYKVTKKFVDE